MSWVESTPLSTDRLGDLGHRIRSNKTALRVGLDKHFFWEDSSGASAGVPRLSLNTGPGSARGFYGTASQVSAWRDGALMVTSDTSRLHGLTSASSALLGAINALTYYSSATITQNSRVLPQTGLTTVSSAGTVSVTFGTAYGAPPLSVSLVGSLPSTQGEFTYGLGPSTTTGFVVRVAYVGVGADSGQAQFQWLSLGTVAL